MEQKVEDITGMRLKECREQYDLTLEEVALKVGVNKSTILRWEKGETDKIKISIIQFLAKIYNVNPAWLAGVSSQKYSAPSQDKKTIRIPVLGSIPAGIPLEAIEDIIDYEDISSEMMAGGKEYFGLKIHGDSMEPKYLDGDIIIVLKQNNCDNGDDAIIMVNGDNATFKKIYKNQNGIILRPINSKYQPLIYTNKEIDTLPITVLGIVKQIRRNIK